MLNARINTIVYINIIIIAMKSVSIILTRCSNLHIVFVLVKLVPTELRHILH